MDSLPYLTSELPGLGGVLKTFPEDFVVEEIPAYLPSGSGEHVWLWVEKRGLSADQMQQHLCRVLQLKPYDLGVAALKDRHAITRQFVSVPDRCTELVGGLETDQFRVLEVSRHKNKLRTGHLKGNRFEIVLRQVADEALPVAQATCRRLLESGVPNYYGEQRFGHDGETLQLGLDLLSGRQTPEDVPPARRRFLVRLALSSVQSWLFNRCLAGRMSRGELPHVLLGDVLQVVASGGLFVSSEPDVDQPRFAAREVVPTGPMFGPKMKPPAELVAAQEAAILDDSGLTGEDFQRFPQLTAGTRRPYLIWPADLEVTQLEPAALKFQFTLPSGAYATVLLRELQKSEPADG